MSVFGKLLSPWLRMGMYSRLFVPIFIIIAMVVGVRYTLLFQGETATADARYQQDASDIGIYLHKACLLYTSPSPRDATLSRMPSSA